MEDHNIANIALRPILLCPLELPVRPSRRQPDLHDPSRRRHVNVEQSRRFGNGSNPARVWERHW